MLMYAEATTLVHGEQLYTDLLARVRADAELVDAMWADAEGRPDELDVPDTRWSVVLLEDGTPAAWCAARIDDGQITCHSNYEVRAWRDRGFYEAAYHTRHRDMLLAYKLPAVTYLFAQPLALHLADRWYLTGQTGTSDLGHNWWELRRPAKPQRLHGDTALAADTLSSQPPTYPGGPR